MTTAVPMLHCMEVLSKEFERAFVDLDLVLTDIEEDEFSDIPDSFKSYMLTMSSCFSQLCHKTQCIAQTNAKLEVSSWFCCDLIIIKFFVSYFIILFYI